MLHLSHITNGFFNSTMIVFIPVVIFLFFLMIIALQMLIYRLIVKSALRRYIEPKLKEKGFIFTSAKWPGFLSNGEFKDDDITLTLMNKNGNVSNAIYTDIFYNDGNESAKISARIETTFWRIKSVVYSSEF
jgi:hypothetical protein